MAAGIVALSNPVESAEFLGSALAVFLGVIGVIIGIASVVGGFRGGGFGAFILGIVSALIGLLFIINPSSSLSFMVTLFAVLLLVDGVAGIYLALRMR